MSGLPMMECSDRLPMFPVVHWMTRKGRSALVVLIGGSFAGAVATIMFTPADVHATRPSGPA
jgi:hypothetical protein